MIEKSVEVRGVIANKPGHWVHFKNITLSSRGFCLWSRPQSGNIGKWKYRLMLEPDQRTEETVENYGDSDISCRRCPWKDPKMSGIIENQGKDRYHSHFCIAQIG